MIVSRFLCSSGHLLGGSVQQRGGFRDGSSNRRHVRRGLKHPRGSLRRYRNSGPNRAGVRFDVGSFGGRRGGGNFSFVRSFRRRARLTEFIGTNYRKHGSYRLGRTCRGRGTFRDYFARQGQRGNRGGVRRYPARLPLSQPRKTV